MGWWWVLHAFRTWLFVVRFSTENIESNKGSNHILHLLTYLSLFYVLPKIKKKSLLWIMRNSTPKKKKKFWDIVGCKISTSSCHPNPLSIHGPSLKFSDFGWPHFMDFDQMVSNGWMSVMFLFGRGVVKLIIGGQVVQKNKLDRTVHMFGRFSFEYFCVYVWW